MKLKDKYIVGERRKTTIPKIDKEILRVLRKYKSIDCYYWDDKISDKKRGKCVGIDFNDKEKANYVFRIEGRGWYTHIEPILRNEDENNIKTNRELAWEEYYKGIEADIRFDYKQASSHYLWAFVLALGDE